MEFEQKQSGLVVPKQKPEKPKRRYGPLELQTEDRRELAKQALWKLWDAMDLSNPGRGIELPDSKNYETYYQVYEFVGEMLLGDDLPAREIKC